MSEMADTLTKQERTLRQRFVESYLVDYDAFAAALRLGYAEQFAEQYSRQFMLEPYVRKRIAEREAELGVVTEEQQRKKIVAGLYREAHSRFNSGAARVAAFTQLAKIIGIEAPVKTELKLETPKADLSHLTLEEKLEIRRKLFPNAP